MTATAEDLTQVGDSIHTYMCIEGAQLIIEFWSGYACSSITRMTVIPELNLQADSFYSQ